MKKSVLVSVMIALAMILALPGMTSAAPAFNDISSHWAAKDIQTALDRGFVAGYPDGTFKPNGTITRAEAAGMLSRITKLTPDSESQAFPDLEGHWSRDQVRKLASLGFIDPADYAKGFEPDKAITRFELMKWIATGLARSDESFRQALSDTKGTLLPTPETYGGGIEDAQIPYIAVVKGTGIIAGFEDGTFRPANNTTRAEVVSTLLRYEKVEGTKAEDYLALNELREVGTTGTNLTSLTPYVYGKNGEFKNFIGKPITLSNKYAVLKMRRFIVVDETPSGYKGVYANYFVNQKYSYGGDEYYPIFVELSIDVLDDRFDPLSFANGTVNGITNGYRLDQEIIDKNIIPSLPYASKYFEKGASETVWVRSRIEKYVRNERMHYADTSVVADDGSDFTILLYKDKEARGGEGD